MLKLKPTNTHEKSGRNELLLTPDPMRSDGKWRPAAGGAADLASAPAPSVVFDDVESRDGNGTRDPVDIYWVWI
uniref:Uncharacterized protein n=1 Tax=Oryza brachyantha TaxID=4533 RepID=J3L8K9_ORYBR